MTPRRTTTAERGYRLASDPLNGAPITGAIKQTFAAPAAIGTSPMTAITQPAGPPTTSPTTISTIPNTTRSTRPAVEPVNFASAIGIPPLAAR